MPQVPTSVRTREQAESLKIPLATLNEQSQLDVAIDGAGSVDPAMVRAALCSVALRPTPAMY